jgi:hypothetical protein
MDISLPRVATLASIEIVAWGEDISGNNLSIWIKGYHRLVMIWLHRLPAGLRGVIIIEISYIPKGGRFEDPAAFFRRQPRVLR